MITHIVIPDTVRLPTQVVFAEPKCAAALFEKRCDVLASDFYTGVSLAALTRKAQETAGENLRAERRALVQLIASAFDEDALQVAVSYYCSQRGHHES